MISQYQILNGDALKGQFPVRVSGEIIVCRECLVDGPVNGETLDNLFERRANFIANSYDRFSKKNIVRMQFSNSNLFRDSGGIGD
ncbi:MAG: hypothetical protein GVY07_01180 [Bacteroidetes bacterium]|jgi:hypothetical protein|nr:hypothetical protein [Bacteroidota bacterium]